MGKGSVIVEFHSVGAFVKVSAIDSESLVEVSIVGDPSVGEAALQRAAVRKLEYVLSRRAQPAGARTTGARAKPRAGLLA